MHIVKILHSSEWILVSVMLPPYFYLMATYSYVTGLARGVTAVQGSLAGTVAEASLSLDRMPEARGIELTSELHLSKV
jgi:hypothetical protein